MPTPRPPLGDYLGVAAAALLARVWMWHALAQSIYGVELTPDEGLYHQWAQLLSTGSGDLGFVSDFARLPARIYAALYSAFGPEPGVLRAFNAALGVAACVLVFELGNQLGGRRVAWLAAGLAVALRPLTFLSVTLHKSSLEVILIAGGALLWLRPWPSARAAGLAAAAAGCSNALAVDVRANAWALLVVAPIAWWIVVERRRTEPAPGFTPQRLVGYALGVALGLATIGGSSARLGPSGGFNLYLANNPDNPTPYYRPVQFASTHPAYQATGFVIEASRRNGQRLGVSQASAYWTDQVLAAAWQQPALALSRLGLKTRAVLHRFDAADNHQLDFLESQIPALRAPWLDPGVLLPLFAAALCLLGVRDRRAWWLTALIATYAATLLVFFCNVRIRLPLLVLMLPIAALGLARLFDHARRRELAALRWPLLAAALFAVVARLPLPGVGDLSAAHKLHALILFERGDLDGAERHYQLATRYPGTGGQGGHLGLAAIAEHRRAWQAALQHLAHVPEGHPQAAEVAHLRARLALRLGDVRGALAHYRQSLALNASDLEVHRGLVRLLAALGLHAEHAAALDEERRIASFYPDLVARPR
jgi:tetratricopeptide (TPR) repeat protein